MHHTATAHTRPARTRPVRHLAIAAAAAAALTIGSLALPTALADHTEPGPDIRVNQHAYALDGAKGATYVTDATGPQPWELVDATGTVLASGTTTASGTDPASGDNVHDIDFTAHTTPGTDLRLQIDGAQSHPFDITADPWDRLREDSLAFYYHQRSGIDIEAQYVGEEYARPAGHLDAAPNQGDGNVGCLNNACDYTLDVTGGWYDAGDHGKYVVNSGISVWQLQNAYERALHVPGADPSVFDDGALAIPEADNGIPDLLDEARWNLEFMIAMQVPEGRPLAGMAHHKVHDMNWTALPMWPHEDPEVRRLSPPSVTATLNLAAAAAQAARLWTDLDPQFAAEALEAARTAYDAALANPTRYPSGSDGTGGGAYGDNDASDEFYWAAAELYVTTGEEDFLDDVRASEWWFGEGFTSHGFAWPSTAPLADLTMALVRPDIGTDRAQTLRDAVVAGADTYVQAAQSQGYPVPYAPQNWNYVWGSNSQVLNNATVVAYAYDFTGGEVYLDTVTEAMDYILGRNALGQSYVTGYGEKDARNQHHRFWANQADPTLPNPPPGTLAGGPNSALQDEVAREHLTGCSGPKCYIDDIESYSTNEVTINWNASLAWVAAFLSDQAGDAEDPGDPDPTPTPTDPVGDLVPVSGLTAWADWDTVELTWDAQPWDNEVSIARDGTVVATLPGGSTAYTDTGLSWGTEYTYTVTGVPEPGWGAFGASVTVTTEFGPDEGECQGTVEIVGDWGSGFQGKVVVRNYGNSDISSWTVDWPWSGSQQITSLWNADWSQSGSTVTASDVGWNGTIAMGGSVEFGFIANGQAESLDFIGCTFT
ncbi:glycoside hydrolase family 9 protein [Glycomyces sp. NRRL B-16210]|uniref:glycoside hydrolase family 9 protein n=1 Tax=Glycomyces sp. NRRL B-16210 TaxID=1463821 RepID=UPI000689632F|nr:glycoside hydrolase family 9 protein [Glycomyces sp. NRRL B-16210]